MKKLLLALSLFTALISTEAQAQNFQLPTNATPENMIHALMECRSFYLIGAEAAKQTPSVNNKKAMSKKLTDIADNFLNFSTIIAKQNKITPAILSHLQKTKLKTMVKKVKAKTYPKVILEYKDSCSTLQQNMITSLQKYSK